jgi:hypothetical protein
MNGFLQRYWIRDTGYGILDAGNWILNASCQVEQHGWIKLHHILKHGTLIIMIYHDQS